MQDVLNYGEFVSCLTKEEQQQLLKYLPSVDISGPPDRYIPANPSKSPLIVWSHGIKLAIWHYQLTNRKH